MLDDTETEVVCEPEAVLARKHTAATSLNQIATCMC